MIPFLAILFALVFAANAGAASQRPFKETFGAAEQPTFGAARLITIARKPDSEGHADDVLIGDQETQTILRFQANGKPAPFTALGSNVIDGAKANGKPCAEEPASCDETPQGAIQIGDFDQVAIDESGGPADGDIYLSQEGSKLVDIFAGDGHYLGQLTKIGLREFQSAPRGITVDSSGVVYVKSEYALDKFVPRANPVTNEDFTGFIVPNRNGVNESGVSHGITAGSGPSAGSIFVTIQGFHEGESETFERVFQVNEGNGQIESEFDQQANGPVAIDPVTHNVLAGSGLEYEVAQGSQPVKVGHLIANHGIGAVAINGSGEAVVIERGQPTIGIYGAPAIVPTVTTEPASEVSGTKATLSGTVNSGGGPEVTECYFEYSGGTESAGKKTCEGLSPTGASTVHVTLEGLEPNGVEYNFHLVALNEIGREESENRTFTTAATVVTEPATGIGLTAATLNGILRPEGSEYSDCTFEYGLVTSASFERKVPCNTPVSSIGKGFQPQEVSARATGLVSGLAYRYRLVATSTNPKVGTLEGGEQRFTTAGLPRIGEVRASGADQGSVTLEATIDPNGFGTTYRFEWGQTPAYGNLAPVEFAPFIGAGQEPIAVQAKLTGLAPGTTYHYRVSATNGRGVTQTADHTAETLDTCNLPDGRCFELVSRSEAGPVAVPGEANAGRELHFQAAKAGAGTFAYPVESGYPEATKGAEVLYRGVRGPAGWVSTQLSPPLVASNEAIGGESISSDTRFLSDDLECGFTESGQPLTADAGMKLVREAGGGNLYRINPDGSYTGVTKLPPDNVESSYSTLDNYLVADASQDCSVVLFSSSYRYSGIATEQTRGEQNLYEWRDGTLRNVGLVPGPEGEDVVVAALPGSGRDFFNAVSEDGSRIFFSAARQTGPNKGAEAVFVREDGRESRDLSLSETSVPDEGATYQWATPDGSKVFFTANAGLTEKSNLEGTDLYEYDLETDKLTDRTVVSTAGGAGVIGFAGASADGSQVYFASQSQLIPGSGSTRAQNLKAKTFSLYGEKAGAISFVATFTKRDYERVLAVPEFGAVSSRTSEVSPDGRYLIFESSAKVTGYESANLPEVYLYDAQDGSHGTICVSCRQDGQPSAENRYGNPGYTLLAHESSANELNPPQFLTESEGRPRVFFTSPDPLAPGASAGQNNIYEWSHDQVFRLVSAVAGTQTYPRPNAYALFGGASENGADVYLVTPETLNREDGDKRSSVYDARVGGGFPEPPVPPAPCQPNAENSCQPPPQGETVTPGPATTGDSGAQNFSPKKGNPPKKKHHKRKHHKKGGKKKAKKKSARKAGKNGGANK